MTQRLHDPVRLSTVTPKSLRKTLLAPGATLGMALWVDDGLSVDDRSAIHRTSPMAFVGCGRLGTARAAGHAS